MGCNSGLGAYNEDARIEIAAEKETFLILVGACMTRLGLDRRHDSRHQNPKMKLLRQDQRRPRGHSYFFGDGQGDIPIFSGRGGEPADRMHELELASRSRSVGIDCPAVALVACGL